MTLFIRKRCVQECVHHLKCVARSDNAAAHCENVGVIVLSGRFGRETVVAERTAYALEFVCGDRDAYAGSADKYALIAFSA